MSLEDDLCDAEDRCDELETELAACRAVIKDLKEELRRAYRSWCKERGHAL